MMPICDQTTIAVTIRSTGTASTSRPSEPVFPNPIPSAASNSASTQSGTSVATPASVMPATPSTTAAITSGRGGRPPEPSR